jgi:hypothetical protein
MLPLISSDNRLSYFLAFADYCSKKKQAVMNAIKAKQNIIIKGVTRKCEIDFNLNATICCSEAFKGFSLFYD